MKRYFWLGTIFILAIMLRIWNLASLPMGFTPDEAAFGYNAYSLLKTGRDEWGVPFYKLPYTNLESFGDYKLPLYAFLTVPSVAIFGLNEFATRLPNAIFGSLSVLAMYALAQKIFSKNYIFPPKLGGNIKGVFKYWDLDIGHYAALLAAFSPWSIQLSRGAFEANLVTLLLPLFLALFLSQKYLFASLILALNFYSYHSARYISLLLIGFSIYKFRKLPVLLALLVIPVLPGTIGLFGSSSSRATDVSILSPTDNWHAVSDARFAAVQSGLPDPIARLFYNKATFVTSQFTKNYLTYFSPQFLFTEGPKETTYGMHPGTGVMYPIESFFLLAAIYLLIRYSPRLNIEFWILIILAVAPAALSKGPGSAANRAAPMLPFLILFSSLGFSYLSKYIHRNILVFLISLSLVFFWVNYLFHARDLAPGMLYGRKEAILRVADLAKDYEKIFVSRSLSEPHIYVAFFGRIDPAIYQKNSSSWLGYKSNYKFLDQYEGYTLDKYVFGSLKFNQPNSLYVGLPQDFPSQISPMFSIDFPDGSKSVQVSRL